jgi:hypothetical protein
MPSNMPPWLPSVLILAVFFTGGVLISMHPSVRNRYRVRPAGAGQQSRSQQAQSPGGFGAAFTNVSGHLHYKPMIAAWFGVVSWCLLLAMVMVQMPLPIAMAGTPTVLLLAVPAYWRPRCAVQSCFVDQNGAITLMRRDISIPLDLNYFRYVRMYNSNAGRTTYPSMLVLYRDTRPTQGTRIGSVLFPRVTQERVVVFFNRWWDADGYLLGPRDMAAVFYQACVRAGRTPKKVSSLFGDWVTERGWEVRADI